MTIGGSKREGIDRQTYTDTCLYNMYVQSSTLIIKQTINDENGKKRQVDRKKDRQTDSQAWNR